MKRLLLIFAIISALPVLASAQTTAFNFQGRLNDGTSPANGKYDLEFRLYDGLTGDNIVGTAISKPNLMLVNGVFSTQLDFGAAAFSGADRFIEIRLRATGSGNAFVILGQRQQILSAPYTVRSKQATLADDATHAVNADNATNAQNLGNIPPTGFVQNTSTQQANSNFNVSGNGVVGNRLGVGTPVSANYSLDVFGAVHTFNSNSTGVVAETSGGTNTWSRFYMNTPNRKWAIGTSQNFNQDQFYVFDETGGQIRMAIQTNGNVGIGTTNPTQKLEVAGTTKTNVLEISGGSDLAEKFEFSETVQPGMIVAIDEKNAGKLSLARGAYNRRVAGIVSGANDLAAGMILPNLQETDKAQPVALSGRVWVYADATKKPISAGDLLTTSETAGYAMKVTDHKRAAGATIGKAMTDLKAGKGLVLVLVSLQ